MISVTYKTPSVNGFSAAFPFEVELSEEDFNNAVRTIVDTFNRVYQERGVLTSPASMMIVDTVAIPKVGSEKNTKKHVKEEITKHDEYIESGKSEKDPTYSCGNATLQ